MLATNPATKRRPGFSQRAFPWAAALAEDRAMEARAISRGQQISKHHAPAQQQ